MMRSIVIFPVRSESSSIFQMHQCKVVLVVSGIGPFALLQEDPGGVVVFKEQVGSSGVETTNEIADSPHGSARVVLRAVSDCGNW